VGAEIRAPNLCAAHMVRLSQIPCNLSLRVGWKRLVSSRKLVACQKSFCCSARHKSWRGSLPSSACRATTGSLDCYNTYCICIVPVPSHCLSEISDLVKDPCQFTKSTIFQSEKKSPEYGGTRIEQERALALIVVSRSPVCAGFDMYLCNLQSRCSLYTRMILVGASHRFLKHTS